MTSLAGQIDRLSRNTKAIKATAATTAIWHNQQPSAFRIPGPFTSALLSVHLGDLIRDIDPSELGLFSLTSPTPSHHLREQDAPGAPATGVTRTEFPAPTPLRRPASQRDIPKPHDIDPQIYAKAALKYIDRYQSIRPMPRAHVQVNGILERLDVVRTNIQNLTNLLHQTQSTGHLPSKKLTQDEDKLLRDLQSKVTQLKKRKQILAQQNALKRFPESSDGTKLEVAPSASPHEETFWSIPVATARTLRFTDNLMDEQMEVGDISEISLKSTKPPSASTSRSSSPHLDIERYSDNDLDHTPDGSLPAHEDSVQLDNSTISHHHEEDEENQQHIDDRFDSEGDNSGVGKMRAASQPSSAALADTELVSPVLNPSLYGILGSKIIVNSIVERIVAKIWATAGEVIMPGHPFDTTSASRKPPRGKETIAHLQSLSILSPSLVSPSPSSISSASSGMLAIPTSQQILTAYLLLLLLASPPDFSMPLNEAKDMLASKARAGSNPMSTGQGATRILYGCVAKRLIKIERGGGEQIVKFDV